MITEREWWNIDYERTWLASRVGEKQTMGEKTVFIRTYMNGLQLRYTSFNGRYPMDETERQDMSTFCLRLLFELYGPHLEPQGVSH